MENKRDEIVKGLQYARDMLDTMQVRGAENCNKLTIAYTNIDIFLNMLSKGEVILTEPKSDEGKNNEPDDE